ncbi:MAG: hypothetical protein KGJ89_01365 [Patescibacteria group bacterium]|nr:hypothetical protein [Patescibacteria group bacterium]MDE2015161.1 hypothetical protein [Patescibacteria group bacterium]MDE2226589.1 hypothetical protein [Patescibacteria group bacterium]
MRRLGQHFLKNGTVLKDIVKILELKSGDVVLEVGAGHGELTSEISNFQFPISKNGGVGITIVAIEKDEKLAELLRVKFSENKNMEVVDGDALEIIPKLVSAGELKTSKWKLVGNIPYYITGHLLRTIGELENKPELCVFMIQNEVAERICAVPKMNPVRGCEGPQRTPAPNGMNRLAASIQFWAIAKIVMRVSRENFSPPPEVDSAVIRLEVINQKPEDRSINYYKTIRMLFAQPRKTILNNLAANYQPRKTKEWISEKLQKIDIKPNDRPQNLSIEDIKKIADLLDK